LRDIGTVKGPDHNRFQNSGYTARERLRMKKKVIIAAWMLGLAGIAWSCSNRHDGATTTGLWLHSLALLGAA
jgi:hypothetical protein